MRERHVERRGASLGGPAEHQPRGRPGRAREVCEQCYLDIGGKVILLQPAVHILYSR
jgi:hypothetical protein